MPVGKSVVVDTNTIVSGILLPQSVPGRLLDLLAGQAAMIFSPATRDELLGVISREKFDRYVSAAGGIDQFIGRKGSIDAILQAINT